MKGEETPQVQIAVMHTDLGYIKKSVESIENKIDKFPMQFASKDEVVEIRDEVAEIKKDVSSLNRWRYYFIGASAAIGVVFSKIMDVLALIFGAPHH